MIKSNKNKKKKGFTLVEIIAVIAIIGILAAVLIPSVMGYIREAKKTGVIDQARKVVTAAESYTLKTGKDLADNSTLADIEKASGGLVVEADLDKIDGATLIMCRQIIDSANFSFTVDNDGILDTTSIEAL